MAIISFFYVIVDDRRVARFEIASKSTIKTIR